MSGVLRLGRRGIVCAAALSAAALYIVWCFAPFLAHRAAALNTVEGLEAAVRIDGGNAEHHARLGQLRFFAEQDPERAVAALRHSLELNPYPPSPWLTLAAAHQVLGNIDQQRSAIAHAVETDPTTPLVAWNAALFYLVEGDTQKAFPLFRTVIATDEKRSPEALDLCWRATRSPALMLRDAVPNDAVSRGKLLEYLSRANEADAATVVWKQVQTENAVLGASSVDAYVDALIRAKRASEAQRIWRLARAVPDSAEMVYNGGFENTVSGTGFDWHYQREFRAPMFIDSAVFRSGSGSAAFQISQSAFADFGLTQHIAVQPNRTYRFAAYVRADDFATASGPRFSVSDSYTGERLLLTEDVQEPTPWREVTGRFTTGPATSLVTLRLVREPAGKLIEGRLWIDDVSLTGVD